MDKDNLKWLTIWIFIVSALYHVFILQTVDPRLYLGIMMIIPLIALIVQHLIMRKKIEFKLFSLKKPIQSVLIISVILPIMLGLFLHLYFMVADQGIFLFEKTNEIVVLIVIGLTIATVSAIVEEIVWRGYYHTQLRKSYSIHRTAIVVACIWSVWHLPIAIFYKSYTNDAIGIFSYFFILFITSLVLTFFREWSQSVYASAIFHGLMNVFYFSDGINMKIPAHSVELVKFIILFVIVAFVFFGYRSTLSRKMNDECI